MRLSDRVSHDHAHRSLTLYPLLPPAAGSESSGAVVAFEHLVHFVVVIVDKSDRLAELVQLLPAVLCLARLNVEAHLVGIF